jgi:short-subunit dehydrogenase
MKKEVILITGASSGIGYESAIALKNKGYIVYGAARRMDKLASLKKQGVNIISLDVTNEESMVNCVKTISEKEGGIDILVNNAGYGSYGAIEDVEIKEAKMQVEVNLFGLARMTQLVLPYMRSQNKGKIINISSTGGKIHTPFGGWYHATKFALEGFSDCLRMEVKPFNIEVVIIEPGGIKTDWGIIASENLIKTSGHGAYKESANKVAESFKKMYSSKNSLSNPSIVSSTIVKAVEKKKPKTRYLIGSNAKLLFVLKRVLSDRAYDKLVLNFMSK